MKTVYIILSLPLLLQCQIFINQDITPNINHSVKCQWTDWSQWSHCSVTCGLAQETRSRKPEGNCSLQTERINRLCWRGSCHKNCYWGSWSQWSTCSATCGQGKQVRSRKKGRRCYYPEVDYDEKKCIIEKKCPIHKIIRPPCSWGSWGEWSVCSVNCGQGIQKRSRQEDDGCFNQRTQAQEKNCSSKLKDNCTNSRITNCVQKKVRKNVHSLTTREIQRLQTALRRALHSPLPWHKYQDVAHFHGAPYTGNDTLCFEGRGCCPHGSQHFLPWHRLHMANMEELLGAPLPYWDWTEDKYISKIFEEIRVPFKNFESVANDDLCQGGDRNRHRRKRNIDIDIIDLKKKVNLAFESETYDQFWRRIESPHNDVHFMVGCDMAFIPTAAYDPVFYLHHTNVDRLFAFWQELQKLRREKKLIEIEIDTNELETPLQPFNRETVNPFMNTMRNNRGKDTLDYRHNFCYEYDELKFDGKTPEEYMKIPFRSFGSRYFVGLVLPKSGPSASIQFDVCIQEECQTGGSVSTFGFSPRTVNIDRKPINSSYFYLSEYEVTDKNIEKWEIAYVRVTNSQNIIPVEPVIIERRGPSGQKKGTTFLPPWINIDLYGDLLDSFI